VKTHIVCRTCIMCKYWNIFFEEDWSDITPGAGFQTYCGKDRWRLDQYDFTRDQYRNMLLMAHSCEDYEEVA